MNTETPLLLHTEFDLEKVLLFIQLNAHHVRFLVPPELMVPLAARLRLYAAQNPGRLVLDVVQPEWSDMLLSASLWTLAGASTGFLIAGIPGALIGTVVGLVATIEPYVYLSFVWDGAEGSAVLTLA